MRLTVTAGFFAMAQNVILSNEGLMSAINLVDHVFAERLPAQVGPCTFACHLTFGGTDGRDKLAIPFRVVAWRPGDGKLVLLGEDTLNVPHPTVPTKFRYDFEQLTLSREGRYWFGVQLDLGEGWEDVTRWPVDLMIDGDADDDDEE